MLNIIKLGKPYIQLPWPNITRMVGDPCKINRTIGLGTYIWEDPDQVVLKFARIGVPGILLYLGRRTLPSMQGVDLSVAKPGRVYALECELGPARVHRLLRTTDGPSSLLPGGLLDTRTMMV